MNSKNFEDAHPWLIRQIKKQYWKILKLLNISSFTYSYNHGLTKIKLNPKDDSVSKPVYLNSYENETVKFISRYVNRGDIIFDIGANIGFFSLLFSSLSSPSGYVHAFEPSTREFLKLCKNVELNCLDNS